MSLSCLCGNRLSGNGGECFGNIHSSICFARADQIGCMSDIGIRKFEWMTTREDRNVRDVFLQSLVIVEVFTQVSSEIEWADLPSISIEKIGD